MSSLSRSVLALAAAILVAGVAGASAQVAPQAPGQAAQQGSDIQKPLSPAQVQSMIDGYVIVQAEKALNLTDAQFPQFVTRLRALQETRRLNQRQHNQLMQELARLTNPANATVDEPQLREKLKALGDLELKSAADLRKAYESIDQILDIRQQARLRVFLDQVERRMLEILIRARAQTQPTAPRGGRR